MAGGRFTDSAWCQAKQRLPLVVLTDLARQVRDRVRDDSARCQTTRWKEHPVYIVDASNFSMSDTPELREHFGDVPGQKAGCAFPIAHWLTVFDLHTGVLVFDRASSYGTADLQHTPAATAVLGEGAILLGDDAFGGYAEMALLFQQNLHCVFPSHHMRLVDF